MCGRSGRHVGITDVIIGCIPFIVVMCLMIVLLLLFPDLALWLTQQMKR